MLIRVLTDPQEYLYIMNDPRVRHWLTEGVEFSYTDESLRTDGAVKVGAFEGEKLVALGYFQPLSLTLWAVHTIANPEFWGPKLREAADGVTAFVKETFNVKHLISPVPDGNRLAAAFARRSGFSCVATFGDVALYSKEI